MADDVNLGGNTGAPSAPVTTPSVTDNAPPTAPVTAPVTTPAPKPTSFQAALEKASAAADPSSAPNSLLSNGTKTPVPDPKAAPAAQVGPDGKPVVQTPQDDPTKDAAWMGIPEGRRNTILQNARKDERKIVQQEFEQHYGWAADLDGEKVTAGLGVVSRMYQDPVKFVVDLIGEIRQNSALAPVLAQALGQVGTGQPAPSNGAPKPTQGWQIPKAALRSEDGKEAYAAEQVVDIVTNKVAEALEAFKNEHLQPLGQRFEQMDEREQVVQLIHDSRTEAAEVMAEMRQMPHFKENEAKIGEILKALPPKLKERAGAIGSLQIAYNKFLRDSVFPTIETAAEQRVTERMRTKAAAGSGQVTPAGQSQSPGKTKPKTPEELSRHMAAMAALQG